MDYIVLDLEWNQSSARDAVPGLNFEIIEIGAVKLNESRVIISEFSSLIKPQVYHELNRITSRLIHLQMRELERGKPFPEVMEQFLNWCGSDIIFCTWGPLDLTELQSNMRYHGMEPLSKGPLPFLDVQKLFSLAFEDGKSRRSLEYAADYLRIEKDIPFHRAFSDSYYTGKVLARIPEDICKNYSYDLFDPPHTKEEEVHIVFDTYAKYISRIFPNKKAALADREVTSCKCYLCGKNIKRKMRWFSTNGKHYYSVSVCDRHGYMKGKIRIRKAEDEQVYVVKTSKFISAEDAQNIMDRQARSKESQKLKKKRRKRK